MDSLPADAPQPRLCQLQKWPDFDGFGFNLQLGQFIGKVDDDSPAQHAQLREGDRIIEVNDVNIANENHRQVVERIKAVPNETRLLVLDRAADRYYRERNWIVHGNQSNVLQCKTPNPRPPSIVIQNAAVTIAHPGTTTISNAAAIIHSIPSIDQHEQDQLQSIAEAQPAIVEQSTPQPSPTAQQQTATVIIEPVLMNEHVLHPQQVQIHVSDTAEVEKELHQNETASSQEPKVEPKSRQATDEPKSSDDVDVKKVATAKVSEVIGQAQARVHSTTNDDGDIDGDYGDSKEQSPQKSIPEVRLRKKDSLIPPVDNQQTIQAVIEAAEQMTDLKLIVGPNNVESQKPEIPAKPETLTGHEVTANILTPNAPIKHHHNFIVINSEEQFAHERMQKEQQQQHQTTQLEQHSLPSHTRSVTKIDSSDDAQQPSSVRQHHRTNGSIGSELSQSSQGSEHSQNSLSTNNNNNSSAIDLNLNMSALEMRKMLSQRKNRKIEAKKAQMDLRQKYEIIQQM